MCRTLFRTFAEGDGELKVDIRLATLLSFMAQATMSVGHTRAETMYEKSGTSLATILGSLLPSAKVFVLERIHYSILIFGGRMSRHPSFGNFAN